MSDLENEHESLILEEENLMLRLENERQAKMIVALRKEVADLKRRLEEALLP